MSDPNLNVSLPQQVQVTFGDQALCNSRIVTELTNSGLDADSLMLGMMGAESKLTISWLEKSGELNLTEDGK